MKVSKRYFIISISASLFLMLAQASAAENSIYHDGWIDLNKNGKMDPYENPKLDVEKRIDDLLGRMTVEEKTCQMATLYGLSILIFIIIPMNLAA